MKPSGSRERQSGLLRRLALIALGLVAACSTPEPRYATVRLTLTAPDATLTGVAGGARSAADLRGRERSPRSVGNFPGWPRPCPARGTWRKSLQKQTEGPGLWFAMRSGPSWQRPRRGPGGPKVLAPPIATGRMCVGRET